LEKPYAATAIESTKFEVRNGYCHHISTRCSSPAGHPDRRYRIGACIAASPGQTLAKGSTGTSGGTCRETLLGDQGLFRGEEKELPGCRPTEYALLAGVPNQGWRYEGNLSGMRRIPTGPGLGENLAIPKEEMQ
jgi:hypothetical protein